MQEDIVAKLDLSDKYFEERFFRMEEDLWGDLKRETKMQVKRLIETSMEFQVNDLIGSSRWQHNAARPTYRNGHYPRSLLSSYGHISNIMVPRVRDGSIEFKILKKYQRRAKDVDGVILEMFLSGVSTRRVEEVLRPLVGVGSVSAGLVSKVTKVLDKQVKGFHYRELKDRYEYLILDGIYLNAKSPVYKKRRCILVAYGIWIEGGEIRRELIDFHIAPKGESENAWNRFLGDLYHRGIEGEDIELIVIDGNKGLYKSVDLIYPHAKVQRCWAHKLRNVSNKVPRKLQDECISQARKIYNADSGGEAVKEFKKWAKVWRPVVPDAVRCLEEDLEQLLSFYECRKDLWKKLRTTNAIERSFREVRRRTRPMSCFQNRESVERIIFAIFYRQNIRWGNDGLNYLENSLYEITQFC